MKTFQWPLRAFLFVCTLQILSCTKSIDKASTEALSTSVSGDATLAGEFSDCKLRYIIHKSSETESQMVKGLFTYNKAGNPISLTYTDGTQYDNYFVYDKNNRLIEFRKSYNNEWLFSLAHRYGYNSKNQIITDTLLNGDGYLPNGNISFSPRGVSLIEYDNQGRVVKETVQLDKLPKRYPTYTYDARGNLAVKGWKSSSYDNKVSLFRAHPVFQFINRNYSRNNAAPQPKYNSKGLPLSMHPANDDFFNALAIEYPEYPWAPGGITTAGYDCQ